MYRILRHLAIAGLLLLPLAAGGAGLFAWRLAQGPVSLDFMGGALAALVDRSSPVSIGFSHPALTWDRAENEIYFAVDDLVVRTRAGAFVGSAPHAGLRFDVAGLLSARLLVREVNLTLPALQLVRDADGALSLAFDGRLTALPLSDATRPGGVDKLLGGEEGGKGSGGETLRRLRVSADSLRLVDARTGRQVEIGNTRLRLTREGGGWETRLDTALKGGGSIRVTADPGAGPDEQQVALNLQAVPLTFAQGLTPEVAMDGTALRVWAAAAFSFDTRTRTPGTGNFRLRSEGGSLSLPTLLERPLRLDPLALSGTLSGWQTATLDPARVTVEGVPVELRQLATDAADQLRLDLASPAGIDLPLARTLWPLPAAPKARAWVTENVRAGEITRFALRLPRAPGVPASLSGDFNDAALRVLKPWPEATVAAGTVDLGGNRLDVRFENGVLDDLAVPAGSVALTGLAPGEQTQLATAVDLRGSLGAGLRLLGREPVRLRLADIRPAEVSGRASAHVEVGLPLTDPVADDAVTVKARATLADVAVPDALGSHDLSEGQIELAVTRDRADARGRADLDDVPADFVWREQLRESSRERRHVELSTQVDPAALARLGAAWDGFTGGTVPATVTVDEPRRGPRQIDVTADLGPATLGVAALGISKPPGIPGRLDARVTDGRPQRLRLDAASVSFGDASLRASADLDPADASWRGLSIDRLRWPGGDLTASLSRGDDATVRGRIDADLLDLRAIEGARGNGAGGDSLPPLDLSLTARRVFRGDLPFETVDARLARDRLGWRSVVAAARLPGGGSTTWRYDLPASGRGGFSANASDFGALLRAAGLAGSRFEGGTLRLDGTAEGMPDRPALGGEAKARGFLVRDAPFIARLFSLASFQGIDNTVNGRGLLIDRLTAPFTFYDGTLTLAQARAVGSQLGARVDGTVNLDTRSLALNGSVAPAYTLNRLIGQVPLVGGLLRGDRADAALAATFGIGGTFDTPQLSVNPLAALVPGAIRDLFRTDDPQPAP